VWIEVELNDYNVCFSGQTFLWHVCLYIL